MIVHDSLRRSLRNFALWVLQMPELLLLSTLDEGETPTLIEITVHGKSGSGRLTVYSEQDPEDNRRRFFVSEFDRKRMMRLAPEAGEIPSGGRV